MNSGASGAATTDAASVHTMPESFDHLFGFGLPSASAFYRASFGLLVYNIHYMLALVVVVSLIVSNFRFQKLIAAILFCLHMLHIRSDPVYATLLLMVHTAAAATGAPRHYYTIPLIFLLVQGTSA